MERWEKDKEKNTLSDDTNGIEEQVVLRNNEWEKCCKEGAVYVGLKFKEMDRVHVWFKDTI